jgi:hypothetical protein
MKNLVNGKKVKMNLVGLDGNSFSLMGHFRREGKRQGWTNEEINIVLNECMKGDYDHLLVTLINHTEEVED